MNFVLWPVCRYRHALLKVQQLEVKCETKTLDNVFIKVIVAINHNVLRKVSETFYELTNPQPRSRPTCTTSCARRCRRAVGRAFESKEEIAVAIKVAVRDGEGRLPHRERAGHGHGAGLARPRGDERINVKR